MSDRIKLSLSDHLRHPFLIASAEELADLPRRVRVAPVSDYDARMRSWLGEHIDDPLPDCPAGGLGPDYGNRIEIAHLVRHRRERL